MKYSENKYALGLYSMAERCFQLVSQLHVAHIVQSWTLNTLTG